MIALVRGETTSAYPYKIAFFSRKGYPGAEGGNESGFDLVVSGSDCYWWTSNDRGRAVNVSTTAFYNNAGTPSYPITEENHNGWTHAKTNMEPVRCVKNAE